MNIIRRIQEKHSDSSFYVFASGPAKLNSVLESPAKKIIQMMKWWNELSLSYQFLCHCLKNKINKSTENIARNGTDSKTDSHATYVLCLKDWSSSG